MSFFRNMDQPESNDITKLPAYTQLSTEAQREVNTKYESVYRANQGKMGIRVAQGIAYATAKQMCESLEINEAGKTITPDIAARIASGPKNAYGKKSSSKKLSRKDHDDAMASLGLKKVKGALGGTYYEGEEVAEGEKCAKCGSKNCGCTAADLQKHDHSWKMGQTGVHEGYDEAEVAQMQERFEMFDGDSISFAAQYIMAEADKAGKSAVAEAEIEEGLGPVVNGKQKPITKFAGSWADQEAKRKAAAKTFKNMPNFTSTSSTKPQGK